MTDTPDTFGNDDHFIINNTSVIIDDEKWINRTDLHRWVARVVGQDEFSLLLTNDTRIQQLNNDFRGKDKPTNVLSFPNDEGDYLGDIAISIETIEIEALQQEKEFYHHFTHMLVHGLLHLKGYDHDSEQDAEEMETLEIKILADTGIENPYI